MNKAIRRFVALSSILKFCPHCNELLKAFEILDSNLDNDETFSFSVIQEMEPDDPIDKEIMHVSKGMAPAILTEYRDVYVGGGDYRMLKDYFDRILEVGIWEF